MSDPKWWNIKGAKMEVDGVIIEKGTLPLINIVNGSVARIVITLHGSPRADFDVSYWLYQAHSNFSGTLLMERADLERAFGLVDGIRPTAHSTAYAYLAKKFGTPDAAALGQYYRIGNCLNMPFPGTGLDGDSNISVEITPEIKATIRTFLDFTAAAKAA